MSRPKMICSIPNCADPQCDREHVYTCCFCSKTVSEDEGVWTSFRRVAHAACLLEWNKEEQESA